MNDAVSALEPLRQETNADERPAMACRATIFALKRADQATRNSMDEGLAPYGLTSAQLDILLYLDERGEAAQRDLQAALGITSATLTRILDGMVARGFVGRRPDEADGRVKCVALTRKGCDVLEELGEKEEEAFLRRFAAGFSADELRTLTGWLNRIASNMGDTSRGIFGYGATDSGKECRS
jgi:DNA-binding MarR family transcriptional regulator